MTKPNQRPLDVSSEGNALSFSLRNMIGQYSFIDIVRVTEITDDTLTVISMLHGLTTDNAKIDNEPIYGVPYLRLQRGSSAVIMDPVVGDVGLMAVCDRDITNVKATKTDSVPNTKRTHSVSDAVYLTGIGSLNTDPDQYVKFNDGSIDIVSPNVVNITAPSVNVKGDVSVDGSITSTGETTAIGIPLSTHVHGGVESGGSKTSSPSS